MGWNFEYVSTACDVHHYHYKRKVLKLPGYSLDNNAIDVHTIKVNYRYMYVGKMFAFLTLTLKRRIVHVYTYSYSCCYTWESLHVQVCVPLTELLLGVSSCPGCLYVLRGLVREVSFLKYSSQCAKHMFFHVHIQWNCPMTHRNKDVPRY